MPRHPHKAARLTLTLTLLFPACGDPIGPPTLLDGHWGGPHFGITVLADHADTWFDCAHGHIDAPIPLDPEGKFTVAGDYVVDAGPAREYAAVYQGALRGTRLDVIVLVQAPAGTPPDTLGPFVATRDSTAQVVLCR